MPPSKLQAHLKRLQGVMLISVCQGTFADAVRLSSRCNTNCKLHTDEGDGCFFGFAFEGFCAFVRRGCNVIATRCKVFAFCLRSLLLFLRGCAFALSRCFLAVYLPFARLFLLLQYFVHLARFRASCGLYCSRVWLANNSLFVLPPFGDSTTRRGKDGRRAARGQAPRLRGCVL